MGFTAVEEKIKNLFAKRTKEGSGDGVRYDTYLFYFSGLTSEDGSLVLGGNKTILSVRGIVTISGCGHVSSGKSWTNPPNRFRLCFPIILVCVRPVLNH